MTKEEAIRRLKRIADNEAYADKFQDACRLAVAALEKQTPKKITHTATLKTSCTCPNCGNCLDKFEKFGESIVRVKYQYCHFCGQALDWSDI